VGVDVKALFSGKVDKVPGKDLSSNDFTTDDKTALATLVSTAATQQQITDLQTQIDNLKGG
jgi:hypothetical protein